EEVHDARSVLVLLQGPPADAWHDRGAVKVCPKSPSPAEGRGAGVRGSLDQKHRTLSEYADLVTHAAPPAGGVVQVHPRRGQDDEVRARIDGVAYTLLRAIAQVDLRLHRYLAAFEVLAQLLEVLSRHPLQALVERLFLVHPQAGYYLDDV